MRRSRLPLALVLAVAPALAARPAAAQTSTAACAAIAGNLVQNCGFENGTTAFPVGSRQPNGYTLTFANGGGLAGVSALNPRRGSRSFFFADITPSTASTLAQSLSTTVGTPYQISFFAFNDTAADPNNDLTVMFGDLLLRAGPITNGAYQQFSFTGVATSTSTTLAFTGYNTLGGNFIDDLSVVSLATTAPEPATWALFGAGLLAVGGVARRRSGTQA